MQEISDAIQRQREFFATHETRPLAFRREALRRFREAFAGQADALQEALRRDLGKSAFEAIATELAVAREADEAIRRLNAWAKPERARVPLELLPGRAFVVPEPKGVVLIVSPWNYPIQLSLSPLIGAVAAGNCVILKPSEYAPHTSAALKNLLAAAFRPEHVLTVEGDVEVSQALLSHPFDHVFFTGSTTVGRVVMEAAARHLSPVTLELGGKSPAIVHADADITVSAKRIAWGKFVNAGQTCVAPDYVLVPASLQEAFVAELARAFDEFLGPAPMRSPDYARIINARHFARLEGLLGSGTVRYGGQRDAASRFFPPTILTEVPSDAPVMQEEIFGPILPVQTYERLEDAIAYVNVRPKPLALYLFARSKAVQTQVLVQTSAGGVCLNDTIMHVGVPDLPFGGVGPSGMGSYHGKKSFETFSHLKSVYGRGFWPDIPLRYPPYREKANLLRRIFRL